MGLLGLVDGDTTLAGAVVVVSPEAPTLVPHEVQKRQSASREVKHFAHFNDDCDDDDADKKVFKIYNGIFSNQPAAAAAAACCCRRFSSCSSCSRRRFSSCRRFSSS